MLTAVVWPAAVVGGRPHQERLFECVLDVFAGLLHAGLGLVLLAFALGVLVASNLAGLLFGFTRGVLSGILDLIGNSHGCVPSVVVSRGLRMTVQRTRVGVVANPHPVEPGCERLCSSSYCIRLRARGPNVVVTVVIRRQRGNDYQT